MRRRPYLTVGLILAVLGFAAGELQARVFRTKGGATGSSGFVASEFGRQLYRAMLVVSGEPVQVSVVGCDEGLSEVKSRAAANADGTRFAMSDDFGVGTILRGGCLTKFVALAPRGDDGRALVIAAEHQGGGGPRTRPTRHESVAIPLISGGTITRSMKNEDTRTTCEAVRVGVAPADAASFYESCLRRDGWSPAPGASRASGGLRVYLRGGDICCVNVSRAGSDGEARVLLVHKRGEKK